ncbi:MAG: hypothetical protein A2293_16570 [Elusimicrobia bacterium RIFOXYB2_FULL_49_7]|nr:MAG: hypothetical protein A2293_16570 [Elusimicrobia bacterium RIFOXYB2_FULL_49_7]
MRKLIFILFCCLATLLALFYFELPLNLLRPVFHQDIIDRYAQEYHLNPLLITSLIKVESNFIRRAKSHRGAVGLMQILPSTAREIAAELGVKDFQISQLEDPDTNIRFGTYYLAKLIGEFNGNQVLALAAYNAGMNKVLAWHRQNPLVGIEIDDIPYKETRNYVREIMRTYACLEKVRAFRNKLRGENTVPRAGTQQPS